MRYIKLPATFAHQPPTAYHPKSSHPLLPSAIFAMTCSCMRLMNSMRSSILRRSMWPIKTRLKANGEGTVVLISFTVIAPFSTIWMTRTALEMSIKSSNTSRRASFRMKKSPEIRRTAFSNIWEETCCLPARFVLPA